MKNKITLSFDVEEFDIPKEYNQKINEVAQLEISKMGLDNILNLLDKLDIKATFFTTVIFAKKYPKYIKEMSKKHEIASHGISHSEISEKDLKKSFDFLGNLINKKIKGFRAPRLKKFDYSAIVKAGYSYDSSMNPTFVPGRYNNFFKKRTPFYSKDLLIIPISVTPLIRFPVFWLTFKNFPISFIKLVSSIILKKDNHLNIFFHPWEFTDISKFKLPFYIKRDSGKKLLKKLEKYLNYLKRNADFITLYEFKNISHN